MRQSVHLDTQTIDSLEFLLAKWNAKAQCEVSIGNNMQN